MTDVYILSNSNPTYSVSVMYKNRNNWHLNVFKSVEEAIDIMKFRLVSFRITDINFIFEKPDGA